MERRFRVRLDELLDDAEVRPGLLRGVLPRLEAFLQPFVEALQSPEQQTNAQHYVQGLLSDLDRQGRRVDRLPARPGTAGLAEVHRPGRVGPPAAADRTGTASRDRIGRSRRRVGLRPLGLSQEGDGVGGRAAAVVRPARQDRQLPGRHLPGLRLPVANTPWSISASTCPRSGPTASGGARRPACRTRSASARGTN